MLSIWISSLYGPNSIQAVDLQKVHQKKVRKYLQDQKNLDIEYFSELQASMEYNSDIANYYIYEKTYMVKANCDFVWDNYLYSSQVDIWDLNKISFGLMYDHRTDSIIYNHQDCYGLETGQIFFLNLKILNGFYNLPVAFKIININRDKKIIELSYLMGGKATGKQKLQIAATDNGFTQITHTSFVKSDSKLRDRYLYPYFHNKLINEFHGNLRRMIIRQRRLDERFIVKQD